VADTNTTASTASTASTDKRIFFHRRQEGVDAAEFAQVYRRAHETLAADTGARCAVDVAIDDQSALDRVGMVSRPLLWHGASMRWGAVASSSLATQQLAPVIDAASGWRVEEHVAWDYERDWPDGQTTPGVKLLSLVVRRPDQPLDEFKERYRNHVEVAREHHGGCWKYVQNVMIGPVTLPPGRIIDAVSELWFRSLDDFLERFYTNRPESVDAVAADTKGFIDFRRTSSMLVQETMLAPRAVLTAS
jgi:hypothetical protein